VPEEIKGWFKEVVDEYRIRHKTLEMMSGWQNRAEAGVRENKKGANRAGRQMNSPKLLWDFCIEWVAAIRCLTAHDIPGLGDRVPEEQITGHMPDISEYCQFDWYQLVWYHDYQNFPDSPKRLAKWARVAHDVGGPMCFWLIPKSCIPIACTSVSLLTEDEAASPAIQKLAEALDAAIDKKIGDSVKAKDLSEELQDVFRLSPMISTTLNHLTPWILMPLCRRWMKSLRKRLTNT